MKRVKLRSLMNDVAVEEVSDRALLDKLDVSSISTDSRSLKEGDLFVALSGATLDGHEFIGEALKKGASGVVYERAKARVPHGESVAGEIVAEKGGAGNDAAGRGGAAPGEGIRRKVLFVGVENTRKCFGRMARNYLSMFSVRKVVVTGSAGKTTTTGLSASVLSRAYSVVSSPWSYNNDVGVPKTIFGVSDGTDILVQEIGTNHPGEIASLSGIVQQDCAVVTNIGPAHVGFFGSEEEIAREKKSALLCLRGEGTAFLNAEDPFFRFLSRGIAAGVRSFGLSKGDLHPERIIEVRVDGVEFVLGGQRVQAPLAGVHGVLNATAAALVGRHFGLSFGEIREGIEGYMSESGRGRVHDVDGITVIDESYNANPLSLRASLAHFSAIRTGGRKLLVFADMLELGEQAEGYHRSIAEDIVLSGVVGVFAYGDMALHTVRACRDLGLTEVSHFTALEELLERMKNEKRDGRIRRGDAILVKGSRAMRLDKVVDGFLA